MDISALGIKITSSGVVKTTNELNAFAKAASAARVAAKNPITVKAGGAALSKALADMQRLDKAMRGMGKGGAANLAVTGADKAIAELARFTKAVADARAKAGGGITITLKANGSAAAVKNLKEFGTAAGQARTAAAKPINLNFGTTGGGVSGGGKRPLKPILDDLDEVNKRFKFTANEGLNFSRQMADIGVTAAMGMNPLMIALQQGPQLFDIFQTAGARAGVGVGGAFRGALAAAAPFLAFAAAATVAIGAFAAGVGLVTEEINKNSDVTVTWQDVLLGAFDVIKDAISTRVTAAFEAMGLDIGQVWEDVKKYTRIAINFMIGASLAVPKLIAATYDKIGPAIGDAFWSGVNLAIKALNWLIQKSAAGVNALVDTFNSVFGTSISKVMVDGIQEAANPYRGALSALGNAGAKALVGAFRTDYVGETVSALSGAAQNRARLREAAEKGGKDVGKASGAAMGKAAGEEAAKVLAQTFDSELEKWRSDLIASVREQIEAAQNAEWEGFNLKVKVNYEADQEAVRKAAENRERAMRVIYELSDVIGGKLGDQISRLSSVLEREFPEAIEALGAAFKGLSPGLKNAFGNIGAGAQVGSSVDGIFKALGIKSSNTGAQIGGAIGSFAGPLGSIAGSIVGGLIGGLLKKTPKASATISFIAGEAMDVAITGNKSKLKAAAGQMANSVISSLSDLATQLGTELTGNASVSVGIRKGNYRVDPTGQGRTKGAGVLDFGEDQAAALAYAMLDAIKDGVLNVTGSVKTLLTLTDDLSTNVAKVQQFNSVFDELLQMTDPQAFDNQQLDKWRTAMDKLFAEAGATAEELAKLEELTGLKRAEIVEKYAQEVIQNEEQKRQLEIEIMQLQGKEVEALAASRALEYAEMDEATRALAETRDALLDWVAAVEKAKGIFAAQTSIEQEILGLQAQLVKGDEQAALQALALKLAREAELRAADATLVPLLLVKYAYEDQVVAAQAVAAAEQELIDARKAQEDEVKGLNRQWLELIGDTKTLREMDLAALLSDDARELQQRIWDYQDAQAAAAKAAEEAAAAEQARADAIASARDTLTQAYERESGALQEAIDKFKGFADSIADFRKSLYTSNNPLASFSAIRGQFQNTARMASLGDEKALGAFTTDAKAYLDAALQNAGSRVEYDRIVASVAQAARRAEGGALGVASEAQQQIDLLQQMVGGYVDLNDNVVSVVDALAALQALERDTNTPAMVSAIADLSNIVASGNTDANDAQAERKVELSAIYDQLFALNNRLRSWDDGGRQRVVVEDTVTVDGQVAITGQPISVDQVP